MKRVTVIIILDVLFLCSLRISSPICHISHHERTSNVKRGLEAAAFVHGHGLSPPSDMAPDEHTYTETSAASHISTGISSTETGVSSMWYLSRMTRLNVASSRTNLIPTQNPFNYKANKITVKAMNSMKSSRAVSCVRCLKPTFR